MAQLKRSLVILLLVFPMLAFQNCGAFNTAEEVHALNSSLALGEPMMTPTPMPTPTPTPTPGMTPTPSSTATPSPTPLVVAGVKPQVIAQGLGFTEGPSYLDGELIFSDQQANRLYKYVPATSTLSLYLEPSDRLNGTAFNFTTGRLLAARGGNGRNVVSIGADKCETILAERYQGQRFNGPNDLVPLTAGGVFFTDPIYGAITGGAELNFRGVFFVSASGGVSLVDNSLQNPNGIALSPTENILYVADDGDKKVYAYDVAANGTTSNKRLFFTVPSNPGGTSGNDGMAMDSLGNLYVTCSNKIWIVSPAGVLLESIAITGSLTNVAFGGTDMKTLYITVGSQVFQLSMNVRGIR